MDDASIRLDGKKILITGVSRSLGIGAGLAGRFAKAGASVAVHGFSDYDLTVGEHNSAMRSGTEALVKRWREQGLNISWVTPSDFAKHGTAQNAVAEAAEKLHGLDGLILNHCYGVAAEIGHWTEEDIDAHLSVNVRASMMMIQSFAEQADSAKDNAVTTLTSGQYKHIETDLMAYSVSKDAVICLTRGAAQALGKQGIRVNCIDPGPNDTGYSFGAAYDAIARSFPSGRWGTPDDAADLALFLHSSYAKWITGQVIASHGGSRLEC